MDIDHITEWDMRGYNEGDSPWFLGEGYYYADETGEWNGPYGTFMEAELAATVYAASLAGIKYEP